MKKPPEQKQHNKKIVMTDKPSSTSKTKATYQSTNFIYATQ